jgi:hypothetical protein
MFSETIRQKIMDVQVGSALLDVWNPVTFRRHLRFIAQMIKASENLLVEGITALLPMAGGFNKSLCEYYAEHLKEESDHFKWLLDDLEEPDSLHSRDWAAAELAGTQYYMLKHVHPASLLGYMLVLEGFPVTLLMVEELEKVHGKRLLRTVRYHAEHDLEHREVLFKLIDTVPSSLQALVMESAVHTAMLLLSAQKRWEN